MKCVLVFGVALILVSTLPVQRSPAASTALAQNAILHDLAETGDITFTPTTTLHLPIIQRNEVLGVLIAQVNDGAGASTEYDPDIAIDSAGTAYAAWTDTRAASQDIFFSSRLGGGKWSPNERINDSSISLRDDVAIEADGSGNAYAIWDDRRDYPNNNIYFSYRPANEAWGTNVKVNEDNGACCADIAVDSAGNAVAIWSDGRNHTGGNDIYVSFRPRLGNWETNLKVSEVSSSTVANLSPAIAIDVVGNAYAVWIQAKMEYLGGEKFFTDYDVMFSYRPVDGSWSANVLVDDVDENSLPYNNRSKGLPALAIDSSGNALAIWWDVRNVNADVWFAYKPAGGNWGADIKVNDDAGTTSQAQPSITLDETGNAYAVWLDQRNGQNDIYFAYLPKDGTWGPNSRVTDRDSSVDNYFSYGRPRIAIAPSSGVHIVWTDVRNGNADIFSAYQLWRP